jgi:hypothetical protein
MARYNHLHPVVVSFIDFALGVELVLAALNRCSYALQTTPTQTKGQTAPEEI